ncbi:MAG: glyoxylase-like metal-dependent hydrolase (beta-lactamase superfamily II) [Rhodothermales bacterium]|jgi:glyoxylase-like metal-dependent hydrolase (beta-lactamase superfamily II)
MPSLGLGRPRTSRLNPTESNGEPEPAAYPASTFAEALSIDLGDEGLSLRHYGAAHTGGDSVVYFEKADVVHMGDLMFRDFLTSLIEFAETGLASGQSLDALTANDRLPDFPEHYLESWKDDIPNAIRATHQELTAEN